MYRILLLITFSCLVVFNMNAQDKQEDDENKDEEKKEFKDNLFFGGSLWAQFGTVTQVEVAPVAGYHISPRFDAGIGLRYIYYRTSSSLLQDYSAHIYGGSVFTRYILIQELDEVIPLKIKGRLVTHFEYEGLNMPSRMAIMENIPGDRFWSHNYLIGGGLQQKIGKKAYLNILILYNLNQKSYSIYENPIIRIGVNF
ncbi:MAG: hypothetical protein ACOC8S_06985 [Bacteroidota bacterium]